MLNINLANIERVKDLYKTNTSGTGKLNPTVETMVEFVKLRHAVLRGLELNREAEYQILHLALTRAAGEVAPYSPLLLAGMDYAAIPHHERGKREKELLDARSKYIAEGKLIGLRGRNWLATLFPCLTRTDLDFGIESLYALVTLTTGANKTLMVSGPSV